MRLLAIGSLADSASKVTAVTVRALSFSKGDRGRDVAGALSSAAGAAVLSRGWRSPGPAWPLPITEYRARLARRTRIGLVAGLAVAATSGRAFSIGLAKAAAGAGAARVAVAAAGPQLAGLVPRLSDAIVRSVVGAASTCGAAMRSCAAAVQRLAHDVPLQITEDFGDVKQTIAGLARPRPTPVLSPELVGVSVERAQDVSVRPVSFGQEHVRTQRLRTVPAPCAAVPGAGQEAREPP